MCMVMYFMTHCAQTCAYSLFRTVSARIPTLIESANSHHTRGILVKTSIRPANESDLHHRMPRHPGITHRTMIDVLVARTEEEALRVDAHQDVHRDTHPHHEEVLAMTVIMSDREVAREVEDAVEATKAIHLRDPRITCRTTHTAAQIQPCLWAICPLMSLKRFDW